MGYHDDKDCDCTEFDHMVEMRLQEIMAEYAAMELQAMAGRIWKMNKVQDSGARIGDYLIADGNMQKVMDDINTYRHGLGCSPKQAIDEVIKNLETELLENTEMWS